MFLSSFRGHMRGLVLVAPRSPHPAARRRCAYQAFLDPITWLTLAGTALHVSCFSVAVIKNTLTKSKLGQRGIKGLLGYHSREDTFRKDRYYTAVGTSAYRKQRRKKRKWSWGYETSKPIPANLQGTCHTQTTIHFKSLSWKVVEVSPQASPIYAEKSTCRGQNILSGRIAPRRTPGSIKLLTANKNKHTVLVLVLVQ